MKEQTFHFPVLNIFLTFLLARGPTDRPVVVLSFRENLIFRIISLFFLSQEVGISGVKLIAGPSGRTLMMLTRLPWVKKHFCYNYNRVNLAHVILHVYHCYHLSLQIHLYNTMYT